MIDSLNNNKPYDLFVKEQIAGDEFTEIMGAGALPNPTAEQTVALTFLRLAPFTEPRGDETRHEMLSEMTSTVGSVFLGLTVGCAKCHDHKYDRIPTKDFYRMKAFFATIQLPRPEPDDIYQIGGPLAAPFYRAGESEWAARERDRCHREIETSRHELDALNTTLLQRLRNTNTDAGRADGDNRDSHEEATAERLQQLLREGAGPFSDAERERHTYLSSRARYLTRDLKRLEPLAMSLRHSYGPPYEPGVPVSYVQIRGEYDNRGEIVEPGFLSCITGDEEPAPIRLDPFKRWPTRSRRMALAQWIAHEDNPLTARVMMNRLWYWHFGQGIVPTPSDFGQLSGGPSHPELLDWLALEFVRSGWDLKSMHRLLVTSSTFRQSSRHTNHRAAELDPNNRLCWQFPRQRLSAEGVRDSILAVSGRLNGEIHGLPIFPPLPEDLAERVKYSESKWKPQYGHATRKRSIYIYQQRTLTMPMMQVFDALVCGESRPRRQHSVTPLQALEMLNGTLTHEEASYLSRELIRTAHGDVDQAIEQAFLRTLARPPRTEERTEFRQFVAESETTESGMLGVCRVLFNSNEFLHME